MPKAERAAVVAADAAALATRHAAAAAGGTGGVAHPFEVADADHCETGAEAYAHVAPFLTALAGVLGKAPADLAIYDPYYCTGAVTGHLARLGFTNVYHVCEDFYAAIAAGTTPDYDVLLTNPAYSGDHVARLLNFAAARGKPWFALMPAYVATKPAFVASLGPAGAAATYALYPRKRYVYWTPKGLRTKTQSHASAWGNRTSPFVSFWYLNFGRHDAAMRRWYATAPPAARGDAVFVTSMRALPRGFLEGGGGGAGGGAGGAGGGAAAGHKRPRGPAPASGSPRPASHSRRVE